MNLLKDIIKVNNTEGKKILEYLSKTINIKDLMTKDIYYQLGHILKYLIDQHNIALMCDTFTYQFFVHDVNKDYSTIKFVVKEKTYVFLEETIEDFEGDQIDMYYKALIDLFSKFEKPF